MVASSVRKNRVRLIIKYTKKHFIQATDRKKLKRRHMCAANINCIARLSFDQWHISKSARLLGV